MAPAAATLAGYRRDLHGIVGRLALLEGIVEPTEDRADFGEEWTRFPIARLRYTQTRRRW